MGAIVVVRDGKTCRVVETDSAFGDCPNELFAGPLLTPKDAQRVADIFNAAVGENCPRFWRVSGLRYKLVPGFEDRGPELEPLSTQGEGG